MESNVRGKHMSIRLTPKELDLIFRAAAKEHRPAANWARLVLLEACEERLRRAEDQETP